VLEALDQFVVYRIAFAHARDKIQRDLRCGYLARQAEELSIDWASASGNRASGRWLLVETRFFGCTVVHGAEATPPGLGDTPWVNQLATCLNSHEVINMRKFLSFIVLLSIAFALGGTQLALAKPPFYQQRNLISDNTALIPAEHEDALVVNAWGLAASGSRPWWIANNGTDTSTLFNANTGMIPGLVVSIPGGRPTGLVFNNSGGGFMVTKGTASGSSVFIFSSEAGVISGWSPAVPPPPLSMEAQVGVTVADAIYKGLAIAGTGDAARLYATNFHAGTVDVFSNTANRQRIAQSGRSCHRQRIVTLEVSQDRHRSCQQMAVGCSLGVRGDCCTPDAPLLSWAWFHA
jgi:hypothetical protein